MSGFVDQKNSASIVVTEMRAPYGEVARGFNAEALKTRGMKLLEKQDLRIAGLPAILMHIEQSARGIEFQKWMAAFGKGDATFIIVANFPAAHAEELSEPVRKAVLGASLQDAGMAPEAGLSFEATKAPPLVVVRRFANALSFSATEKGPGPMLIIAPSVSKDWNVGDHSTFARRRMLATEPLKDIEITDEKPIAVAGLKGVALTGTGVFRDNGDKQFMLQVALFDQDGYYLCTGLAPVGERSTYEPVFHQIIGSLKLRPKTSAR